MKIKASNFNIIGFLALIIIFGAFIRAPQRMINLDFKIDQSSELFIRGSSNVNNFTCYCDKEFAKQALSAEILDDGREIRFNKTVLELPVMSLDCGKKRMNNDMFETLKAEEFPNIYIELKRVYRNGLPVTSLPGEWTNLNSEVTITIAGVSQDMDMLVSGKSTTGGALRLMSHKDLKMSEFGLETPKALFGLIKVHDCLNINFDLTVYIENPS